MIEDDNQFLEVTALGSELAWRVMKLWMKSAGRTLNNYQESLYFSESLLLASDLKQDPQVYRHDMNFSDELFPRERCDLVTSSREPTGLINVKHINELW